MHINWKEDLPARFTRADDALRFLAWLETFPDCEWPEIVHIANVQARIFPDKFTAWMVKERLTGETYD